MAAKRTGVVVLLGILLVVTLAVGNVVFAAHATVLDPGFTTDAIEEEDGYEVIATTVEEQMASQAPSGGGGEGGLASIVSIDELVEAAVDEEYMQAEAEKNIERVYAYLHGSSDTLNLSLDTDPIAENVETASADALANATTAELMDATGGMNFGDLPIEAETVEQLDEGPEAYEQAQADVRQVVYEEVLASAVDEAIAESSNDELLALVIEDYDPAAYSEQEKEQMVEDRTDEIRSAVAGQIESQRSGELEAETDRVLAERAEAARSGSVSMNESAIAEPATELRDVTVQALTTDMSYETYQAESTAAKEDLGEALGGVVAEEFLSDAGERINLNEAMGIPEEGALQQQVRVVTWLDRLAIVLPLVGLLLVGGVWAASRSVGRTVGTVGWAAAIAGLPTFVLVNVVLSDPASRLGMSGTENPIVPVVVGVAEQTIGRFTAQSLALGLLGVGLVAIAFGLRAGLHERVLGESDPTASGEPVETDAGADPLADRADAQDDSTDSGAEQHEDR